MKLAIGPDASSSSVAFLVGGAAWSDPVLARALAWCHAIQRAAGGAPGVQLARLPPRPGAMPAIVDALGRASLAARLAPPVLDASLGGLRGHTLVIVTRGLSSHGPAPTPDAQGLLLYSPAQGETALDVALWTSHLAQLTARPRAGGLPDDADIVATGADAQPFAPLVHAIRQSPYQRIYLATCGGARRLEQLASQLAALTRKPVYFNLSAIRFATPAGAHPVAVGAAQGGPVAGTRYFRDPDDPANQVALEAGPAAFLPGAQGLAS